MKFKWTPRSKGIRPIADVYLSPQSGVGKKKIVYTEKVSKINHAETGLWISSIYFIISFNKAIQFFYVLEENKLC